MNRAWVRLGAYLVLRIAAGVGITTLMRDGIQSFK